jgi:hypothetical protein
MYRKTNELEFISWIKRDGSGVKQPPIFTKEQDFRLYVLSVTHETYIATDTMNYYVVKCKNNDPTLRDLIGEKSVKKDPQNLAQLIERKNEKLNIPSHYNNDNGSLYKVAKERGWNPYLFDVVKRLERSNKKGEFETDLKKSIVVIELWLKEQNLQTNK